MSIKSKLGNSQMLASIFFRQCQQNKKKNLDDICVCLVHLKHFGCETIEMNDNFRKFSYILFSFDICIWISVDSLELCVHVVLNYCWKLSGNIYLDWVKEYNRRVTKKTKFITKIEIRKAINCNNETMTFQYLVCVCFQTTSWNAFGTRNNDVEIIGMLNFP